MWDACGRKLSEAQTSKVWDACGRAHLARLGRVVVVVGVVGRVIVVVGAIDVCGLKRAARLGSKPGSLLVPGELRVEGIARAR